MQFHQKKVGSAIPPSASFHPFLFAALELEDPVVAGVIAPPLLGYRCLVQSRQVTVADVALWCLRSSSLTVK